jgi:hypothetical protein
MLTVAASSWYWRHLAAVTDGGGEADMRDALSAVRDVLAGDQDGRPRRARTDVLSRRADLHAMLRIAGLLPRRPHLPMRATCLTLRIGHNSGFFPGNHN